MYIVYKHNNYYLMYPAIKFIVLVLSDEVIHVCILLFFLILWIAIITCNLVLIYAQESYFLQGCLCFN